MPLSLWLRVLLAAFALIGVGGIASILAAFPVLTFVDALRLAGGIVCIAIGISSFWATCTVAVDERAVRLGYWILYRPRIPLDRIAELRADRWDSWDFGGYGIKGRPRGRLGLLLNATADATGHGDAGILIRTTDGRTYRIEVRDPERFAAEFGRRFRKDAIARS